MVKKLENTYRLKVTSTCLRRDKPFYELLTRVNTMVTASLCVGFWLLYDYFILYLQSRIPARYLDLFDKSPLGLIIYVPQWSERQGTEPQIHICDHAGQPSTSHLVRGGGEVQEGERTIFKIIKVSNALTVHGVYKIQFRFQTSQHQSYI